MIYAFLVFTVLLSIVAAGQAATTAVKDNNRVYLGRQALPECTALQEGKQAAYIESNNIVQVRCNQGEWLDD